MTTPSAPTGDHGGLRGADDFARRVADCLNDHLADYGFSPYRYPSGENKSIEMLERAVVSVFGTDASWELVARPHSALAAHPEPEPAQDGEVGAVLAAHWGTVTNLGTPRMYTARGGWNIDCECGEGLGETGDDDIEERHRAHLAAVLVAAGVTRA